ncbi:DUF2514 family protein [Ralstonia syzygii subsp. celebesensis]|uniref:Endopeptidase n=2 Tax=Ralstonia syzygii subsp. celebesensis TaxID=1310168 RepID=A0A1U9VEB2_9RALS|nr:DUF2514 family protein [Ralstonia syzygii]AQW29024.1 hypothetical protein B0B51_02640 [blood disease bacterium A2-HR MARDI]QQV54433.1 DUF2514 family protein [Ralstonia syzygii subsp. celebesensis]CCA79291.1 conserved exported hypothetical protein [blood disease bacterium R229]
MTIFDPRVLLAVVLALGLSYGTGRLQQHGADTKVFQAERTKAALDAARVQIKAVDEARIEEQRRTKKISEIADEATQQVAVARADARAAGAAADRLRERVSQLVAASRAADNSAAAGASAGQPGGDPLDVLVDVLSRTDGAAGQLGEYADKLKAAGLACERSYDALTGGAQ